MVAAAVRINLSPQAATTMVMVMVMVMIVNVGSAAPAIHQVTATALRHAQMLMLLGVVSMMRNTFVNVQVFVAEKGRQDVVVPETVRDNA